MSPRDGDKSSLDDLLSTKKGKSPREEVVRGVAIRDAIRAAGAEGVDCPTGISDRSTYLLFDCPHQ